ncbi:hypothetical protein LVY72_02645 [Arthrobacter sp. I2-34]|uniref:Uncharacterized protein n=1 Tax=Arthrobacter hankyongi TaxID=2904801 RepID=A0ABS9L2K8_9MICC|nr:hypothetical protein [Arthrobacter hankyongi]MCG2620808.1 hypothetical protein [Arthrobacter hankyongi]
MTAVPPNDEQFIRQLLDESGVGTSLPLQASLLEMRAAGSAPVPAPSAELAAFMIPATTAPAVVPLRGRRRTTKGLVIGLAVAAATGLGVSGVAAANPQFHAAADQAVRHVVGIFAPAAGPQTPVQPVPDATTPGHGDQAQPTPTKAGTQTPAPDRQSASPAGTATAPAAGTGKPSTPPGEAAKESAKERNELPLVPDLPAPSGVPGVGSEKSGHPGPKVPVLPRPTGPADLPEVPVLPVLPAGPEH